MCVFAKPFRPGEVKTRLASALGGPAASALARAFFLDTWAKVGALEGAGPVLASTEDVPGHFGVAPEQLWLQGEGDLGERMERVARRALAAAPWVLLVGADSPALPEGALEAACAALADHDAVLGPADDGGYYLFGLRRAPAGLLEGLPWSAADTFTATHARLKERGLSVALVEPHFDVDGPADLERLRALLAGSPERAPATAAAMRAQGLL